MKFQDSSFKGLKVTVGTKSVTHASTHPRTHAPKAICPINFFKVGGIMKALEWSQHFPHYNPMGAICCHGHQSSDPIWPKT